MRRRTAPLLVLAALLAIPTLPVAAQGPPAADPVRLVVTFAPGTSAAEQDDDADRAGEIVQEVDAIRVRAVEVPAGRVKAARKELLNDPDVAYVSEDVIYRAAVVPNDPGYVQQQSPAQVRLPEAWDVTTGSESVVIAIVDTGVTALDPDLPAGKLVPGADFVFNGLNTSDLNGHGTASATVAAMQGNNGAGAAGACWACRIMPVRVLNKDGNGTGSDVAAGITWAVDHGARVVNLSLSGASSQPVKDAVAYAASHGVVVVAAAGNQSSTSPTYPAAFPSVIGVAATNPTNDSAASYTNRGTWVKLAAPGRNIALTRTGGLLSFEGTSSAAPLVSGAVGLLLSAKPGLTPPQITQHLQASSAPVAFAIQQGSGRMDVRAALNAAGATGQPGEPDPPRETQLTGGGYTSSRVVTRTVGARPGAVRFEARCTYCGGMRLDVLDGSGTVIATLTGDQRFTMSTSLANPGTYTFRITTNRWGLVTFAINYFQ